MSDPIFDLKAEVRTDLGKGASRRLRRLKDYMPAIIYGADKDPLSIMINHNSMLHALEHEAFYNHILTIHIDNKKEEVVLKDLQRHPAKRRILHADFQRIKAGEKIHMHIPLHFTGEDIAPGVKVGGGMVSHNLTEVEVTCLPNDLPEFIEVNLSNLELEDIIHLSDLKLPKGVELVALSHGDNEHNQAVAAIHKTRGAKLEEEGETQTSGTTEETNA